MNVEISLSEQNKHTEESEKRSKPEDTQGVSGSQVACAFARIESEKYKQKSRSRFEVLTVSMLVVSAIAAGYLALILLQ